MKIAVFSDNFYPELSGITDSIMSSAKELGRLGHEIDFYAPRYSEKDFSMIGVSFKEPDLGENVRFHRMCSFPYPAPTKQARMVIPTFLRWMSMKENKPDIIHSHLFFGVGMEALAASKFLKVPMVGTSHTPISEFLKYGPLGSSFVENAALKFVSWYYNHCDFVSAPSAGILTDMKKYGFKKPSKVISNPIELQKFFPVADNEKHKIRKDFNLNGFIILYTGRLAEEKHIDVIIKAVASLKDRIPGINLAITGHGDAQVKLEELSKELGIGDKVRFMGTLNEEDHARIYKASDVFVIASTAETQSLSLLKAMATGIPVIGVNARALPEYISEENGFIVEPGDYGKMAEKIIFLHENLEKRKTLGQGGIKLVDNFSLPKIAKQWEDEYIKAASEASKDNR